MTEIWFLPCALSNTIEIFHNRRDSMKISLFLSHTNKKLMEKVPHFCSSNLHLTQRKTFLKCSHSLTQYCFLIISWIITLKNSTVIFSILQHKQVEHGVEKLSIILITNYKYTNRSWNSFDCFFSSAPTQLSGFRRECNWHYHCKRILK